MRSLGGRSSYEALTNPSDSREIKQRIIDSYDDFITHTYSRIRFHIINISFLEAMEQHLPQSGRILDIGCGFGLFANYFAARSPLRKVHGIDVDERRIAQARATAERVGLENASFHVGDAHTYEFDRDFDAVVVLDLLHHVGYETADRLIDAVYRHLKPGGIFVLKDVNVRPWWKLLFTFALDKLMDPRRSVHYRDVDIWKARTRDAGFDPVYAYPLKDYLPYPHVLVVCHKSRATSG